MNVKPGDLAIVVPPAEQSLGRIVEVLRAASDRVDGLPRWIVRAKGSPLCGVSRRTAQPGSSLEVSVPDCVLRPVSGLPDTSDVDERLKESA